MSYDELSAELDTLHFKVHSFYFLLSQVSKEKKRVIDP